MCIRVYCCTVDCVCTICQYIRVVFAQVIIIKVQLQHIGLREGDTEQRERERECIEKGRETGNT